MFATVSNFWAHKGFPGFGLSFARGGGFLRLSRTSVATGRFLGLKLDLSRSET